MELVFEKFAENPEEMQRMIEANASEMYTGEYLLQLTEEQLDALRQEYVEAELKASSFRNELAKITADYKLSIQSVTKYQPGILEQLKTGYREERGMLYDLPDWDNRRIMVVNIRGEIVRERAMKGGEQMRIVDMHKIA